MLLNRWQWFRERGWSEIDSIQYAKTWQQYGGSVATHPIIVERLSKLADLNVRYLGYLQNNQRIAAIACWDGCLALSRDYLKKHKKRGVFDLGNAEIILPIAPHARLTVRHKATYISTLNKPNLLNWRPQKDQLTQAKNPADYSKKFRYNQRRELRLLEEAGGTVRSVLDFSPDELASIYCELFFKRWGFAVPSAPTQAEVFSLLREFMVGNILFLENKPIAIQILYCVESPNWINIEYVNGGVDPQERTFSPGSVLSFVNIEQAWQQAIKQNKALRYSFGRADRDYKDRWCHRIEVGVTS